MSSYQSIVILTGAGISAESGIQTFRAADGLWEEHSVEDVATPEGFARDPALVQRFYNERRQQLQSEAIKPNAAHKALAKLANEFAGELTLVTQNIDNLHERAGSKEVLHMHGELLKMRCDFSEQVFDITSNISTEDVCPCCNKAGRLRPHVVWFGEMPLFMERIYRALASCDLFIAIGTSGHVYPAAGFVEQAREVGAHTIELNLEPSAVQSQFAEHIYGKAGEELPKLVDAILAES